MLKNTVEQNEKYERKLKKWKERYKKTNEQNKRLSMSVSKLGEFFHKLGTEDSIASNSKRQSEDLTNSNPLQIHAKIEDLSQKEEKSKNLVLNPSNNVYRRNSKLVEKKPSQVNIIYEETEQSEEKTPIKSPYINSAELPYKRKLSSKKPSYIANNINQLKEQEDRKVSRQNSHQIQNAFLFEEIQKLVKDSNMLSSQNFDLSSNSSGGEEDSKIRNSNRVTFPLKKEKDLFLSIPNKTKKKENNKELTSPIGPAFTAIKKIERNFSVNAEAANNLLAKIIENEKTKKAKNSMSKMNILKMIALIYAEKVTNSQNNLNNPLHVLIYDMFLNKYGLKKIAENKYKQVLNIFYLFLFPQFLESCYFYLNCLKIKMFSRFVNLIEPMQNDDCNYYLSSFKFFDERLILILINRVFY